MSDIGFVLLAAGEARRMGSPKQLLDVGGTPMLRRAAEAALGSQCRPVIVVCGAAADRVRSALAGLKVELVENVYWERGIGTSIRAGVFAMAGRDVDATIVAVADQPLLGSATFHRLVATYRERKVAIVTSAYDGTVGVPALFDRSVFPELLALPAEQGCKGIIQRYSGLHSVNEVTRGGSAEPTAPVAARRLVAKVPCPEAAFDVDTPNDYQRLLARRVMPRLRPQLP